MTDMYDLQYILKDIDDNEPIDARRLKEIVADVISYRKRCAQGDNRKTWEDVHK